MQLEREQQLHNEEVKALEKTIGLKVADLKKVKFVQHTTKGTGLTVDSHTATLDDHANIPDRRKYPDRQEI